MNTASITLPWPPSVNRYWRSLVIGGRGRVVISREGRAFCDQVQHLVRRRWPSLKAPTRLPVAVLMVFAPPDRRDRDLDNLSKATFDALTKAGVWADDRQVKFRIDTFADVVRSGEVELWLWEFDPLRIADSLDNAKAILNEHYRVPRPKVAEKPPSQHRDLRHPSQR